MVYRKKQNSKVLETQKVGIDYHNRRLPNWKLEKAESIKAVYRNPTDKWSISELTVSKPGMEQSTFTVDLQDVNSKTVPIQSEIENFA